MTSSFEWGLWGWQQYLFVGGIALAAIGAIRQVSMKPTYSSLKTERDIARSKSNDRAGALEGVLRAVLNDLSAGLGLSTPACRVSIYCHANGEFVLLSRYSENPEHKKRGRPSYPESEGIIGKTWTQKRAVVVDLPSDRADWNQRAVADGISPETALGLRMQSRSIVGARIDARLAAESLPLGVVIIESTAPRGVNARILDRLLEDRSWAILQNAMANARSHLPEVAQAVMAAQNSNTTS